MQTNKNRRGVLANLVRIFCAIAGISAIRFAPLWADMSKDSAQDSKINLQDSRESNADSPKDLAQRFKLDSPKTSHKGTKMTQ